MTKNPNVTVSLASVVVPLDQTKDGARRWQVARGSSDPDDLERFIEHIPYGSFGMGSSIAAGRNQMDYSLDCDVEQWGQLGPGPDLNKVGLALDNQITVLRTLRDNGTPTQAFAGTVANDSAVGSTSWTNPTNAQGSSDDGVYATLVAGGATTSHYLKCTNFGFAIPTTATILGFRVEVDAKTSSGTIAGSSVSIRPYRAGTLTGSAAVGSASNTITTTEGFVAVSATSGAGETYTTTFTPAEVNASTFGVGISITTGGAVTVSVDRVRLTVFHTPANRYIYAASQNVLTKVNLRAVGSTTIFSTVETKTFTHGDNSNSTPGITDMIALKEGPGPSVTGGRVPTPAVDSAIAIVGFGADAQIQQINRVASAGETPTAVDTYGSLHATKAYGGVFATALSTTNTERVVWKSVGTNSSGSAAGSTGAFHQVQSAQILGTAVDYTNGTSAAVWTPATPYKVGDFGSSITGMTEYQRGLLVAKPEGVYQFDQNYNANKAVELSVRGDENGRHIQPFHSRFVVNSRQDLLEFPASGDATIGLSTLLSNLSPVQGYPTAIARYGKYLFVAYYDGTDTYVVRMRRRQSESVTTEYLFYPMFKVASHKVQAMLVTDDGLTTGNVYLIWDTTSATANKYDIGYLILDPPSARRYETGGQWFSPRYGSPAKRTIIDELDFYGVGLSSTAKWTAALSWDEAAFSSSGMAGSGDISTTGRTAVTLTAGTNDSGYMYRVRLTCTNNTNTNQPLLRSSTVGAQGAGIPMGIDVRGWRQCTEVDRIVFVARVAQGDVLPTGQRVLSTPDEIFTTWRALIGAGPQDLDYDDYGSSSVKVLVKRVEYVEGKADDHEAAPRYIQVTCHRLLSG